VLSGIPILLPLSLSALRDSDATARPPFVDQRSSIRAKLEASRVGLIRLGTSLAHIISYTIIAAASPSRQVYENRLP
jgi:hypothetical protein